MSPAQAVLATCLAFVVGGIVGWVYEELFYRIADGVFSWRGHCAGPWLPIYAFGTVVLLFATAPVKDSRVKVALVGGLVSVLIEYASGWVLYHLFGGMRLWDYNTEIWNWGNLGGFVCLRSFLAFAALSGLLVVPMVKLAGRLARQLSGRAFRLVCAVPFCLFVADIVRGYLIR